MLKRLSFKKFSILKKYLNPAFFLISTLVILSLNLLPSYTLYRSSPPGRTYALIHNNVQDFYFYQALMNEGANGAWLITDPYTAEPSQPSIIFSYFTWLGKISHLFNLPYVYTYHIVRIAGSLLFFISVYFLLKSLKLPYPNLTYLFFLFAVPFFNSQSTGTEIIKVPFMYWWTGMEPVRRASYLPHHMIGAFLLVVSVILILKFISQDKIKYLIFALLLSPLMAFIHTPSLFILLIVLPSSIAIYLIAQYGKKYITKTPHPAKTLFPLKKLFILGFFWIAGLVFLAIMVSQTNKGFPWSQYLLWEKNLQYPLNKELIPALGILFPFSLLGIAASLLSDRFDRIFVASWFAVPFLLIPLSSKLSISNIRLIQGIPYLTLAILAVIGIDFLFVFLKAILHRPNFKIPVIVYMLISVLFLINAYPEITWSIKDQIREYSPIFGNVYLDNRLFTDFDYINRNFPPNTRTVATFYAGNYLPVYTHTISFIGHSGYTYNLSQKELLVFKFFESKMTPEEAKSFLMDNKITLVFQGPEEKPLFNNYLYPEILKPVYDKEEATLYVLK